MIELRLEGDSKPIVARVVVESDGSVSVGEGSTLAKLRNQTTPPSLISGSVTEFVKAKVQELLDRGFYVHNTDDAKEDQISFSLTGSETDPAAGVYFDAIWESLALLGIDVGSTAGKDVTDAKWILGGVQVHYSNTPQRHKLTCLAPRQFADSVALLFALTAGTTPTITNGANAQVRIGDLLAAPTVTKHLTDDILERLYVTRALKRPMRVGSGKGANRRPGLRMTI
ncbi:hypothetical protein RKE25_22680 (plasmid) [Dyella sp. BiH032]|uniref:hypothetical protein n=1 Tax=Dyella sp. BiH032 TaxID=3075430 RepID=UPI002892E712|nr:hypothetical protein [Dyella sp. BiH032]WNL48341.1 hypothetical protein RKE25_22680 [Dyella sp. BiH032]